VDLGLQGRVAIVCGASQGMGRAIAASLAAEGAGVMLVARSEERLEQAKAAIAGEVPGAQLASLAQDLTAPDGRRASAGVVWMCW
jgi:3-oxoacyl-[acyl-carrier protein] reductase